MLEFPPRTLVALIVVSCTTVCAAPSGDVAPVPHDPVRGVWITRWDFRTADDVRTIVANAAALGLNRVYFQVRGRADALYRSTLEPWAEELGGGDPGFDPLAVALEAARAHSLELHAWVNTLAGWKGRRPPSDRRHVYHLHPDWFLTDRFGKRHQLDDHYTILNPCRPEVVEHLTKVMTEIVRRYPVDGLHLDYIRFVAESARDRQAVPYDNLTLRDFRRLTGGFPTRHPERWDRFRREAVDEVVRRIADAARKTRPGLVVSAAVLRDFDAARRRFFQDAPRWSREGWVDELAPMVYERTAKGFDDRLAACAREVAPTKLIAGLGVYLLDDASTLGRQIESAVSSGARGYALFAYTDFFPSRSHESRDDDDAHRRRALLRREVTRFVPAPVTPPSVAERARARAR